MGDGEALLNQTAGNKDYELGSRKKTVKLQKESSPFKRRTERSPKQYARFEPPEEEETVAAYNVG